MDAFNSASSNAVPMLDRVHLCHYANEWPLIVRCMGQGCCHQGKLLEMLVEPESVSMHVRCMYDTRTMGAGEGCKYSNIVSQLGML